MIPVQTAPPATPPPVSFLPSNQEAFYSELVRRNAGLVSAALQQRIRNATILVAGCGSVGGAAVEPLVRFGAERIRLAEPGSYDLANLNRQRAILSDIGRNKADVLAERARQINPGVDITVDHSGISPDTVRPLLKDVDLVIDGVDVTTLDAVRAKVDLHVHALEARVPVVCGYDIAGVQAIVIYDYSRPNTRLLHGKIQAEEASSITPLQFLARVVPHAAIPLEIIPELRRQASGESDGFPQLVYAADLFGVLAVRAVAQILDGQRVRSPSIIDVHQVLRTPRARLVVRAQRLLGLLRLSRAIAAAGRGD